MSNMPFVKLDCKMLDSSLWPEKDQRDLFITALLMAEPIEILKPAQQIKVRSLDYTGFEAPAGWYGFIPAAGIGIIHRCNIDQEKGLDALERLGDPDPESRSNDFEGRRLIRIDGGYLALNYDKYRERDYSNADRCKRYRLKKKAKDMACQPLQHACQHVSDMQAEAEAEEYNKKEEVASLPAPLNLERTKKLVMRKPTLEEIVGYSGQISLPKEECSRFFDYYESKGWVIGKSPMKDWRAAMRTWKGNKDKFSPNGTKQAKFTKPTGIFAE